VATIAVTRRFDLTDAQWAVLQPLLPANIRPGRPSLWTKRQLIDGIRWRVRVGAPWRDVPPCYGSWQAVYSLFRRWQRAGVWQQMATALQSRADAAGKVGWQVSIDSTIARAHQHAAGARRGPQFDSPGGWRVEPADHALGRSRGGWTTKLHLACEHSGLPLAVVLTAGHRADSPQFAQCWPLSGCPAKAADLPGLVPFGSSPTGLTPAAPTVHCCGNVGSARPSRARQTRMPTGVTEDAPEAGLPRSILKSISSATRSSAASTG
jgi:transposase